MSQRIALLVFFGLVTASHALALKKPKSWKAHYWVNGSLWLLLTIWIISIQFEPGSTFPKPLVVLGYLLVLAGLVLSGDSLRRLGLKKAMGYRFFNPQEKTWVQKGFYSKLKNPIYDGFVLIFIGLGLSRGISFDFYLALVSFILLNLILAPIENKVF